MSDFLGDVMADLNDMASFKNFGKTAMSDTEYQYLVVGDVIEWAEEITGEWDGNAPGKLEDRARAAQEVIDKAAELQDLIQALGEL